METVTADRNLYISAFNFGGKPLQLIELARAGAIRLAISDDRGADTRSLLRGGAYHVKTKLALTADFANVTAEGKLNIIGVFDRIASTNFPVVHPQMQLILQFEAQYVERDRLHKIEIVLEDPDGRRLLALEGSVTFTGGTPGHTLLSNQILTLVNLGFERPGGYQFSIFINGHLNHQVPFEVKQVELPEQPQLPGT